MLRCQLKRLHDQEILMNENSTAIEPRNDPGVATAVDGLVVLDGPDGVAVTMTAEAAALTADSLKAAAEEARRNPDPLAGDAHATEP
jgi:hypothetical protein